MKKSIICYCKYCGLGMTIIGSSHAHCARTQQSLVLRGIHKVSKKDHTDMQACYSWDEVNQLL